MRGFEMEDTQAIWRIGKDVTAQLVDGFQALQLLRETWLVAVALHRSSFVGPGPSSGLAWNAILTSIIGN